MKSTNCVRVFNPKYTFKSFVVGNQNSFACATAKAVAEAPGKSYNPVLFHGGVGLGKTHLLHAIGQHVASTKPGARVAYLSAEQFTNGYIDAVQNNQIDVFRNKYREIDVLLVDDIQFFAGRPRILEAFFHTLILLHEAHTQIVMAGNCSSSEIEELERNLISRFEWRLVVDLPPPDFDTRLAILDQKTRVMGVQLSPHIQHFLANRICTDIRRLEGAMILAVSYASLTGKKLTTKLVEGLTNAAYKASNETSCAANNNS